MLVREFANRGELLAAEAPYDPNDPEATLSVWNRHFGFVWETAELDLRGGFKKMMDMLDHSVFNVIHSVIIIEAVRFAAALSATLVSGTRGRLSVRDCHQKCRYSPSFTGREATGGYSVLAPQTVGGEHRGT